MSRRDTIIIAVLVNAAILLILFATAMRSDKKKDDAATPLVKEETCSNQELLAANTSEENVDDAAIEILGEEETAIPLDQAAASSENQPQVVGTPSLAQAPAATVPAAKAQNASQAAAKAVAVQSSTRVEAKASTVAANKPKAAPIATPAPAASASEVAEVTVKKGDALEKIARAHQSSVAAIMKANNLSSTQLKIGQTLKVPAVEKGAPIAALPVANKEVAVKAPPQAATSPVAPAVTKPSTVKSATGGEEYYTVKEGDNPWLIASRHGVKIEELLRINGMDNEKAKHLRVGDKLRIR